MAKRLIFSFLLLVVASTIIEGFSLHGKNPQKPKIFMKSSNRLLDVGKAKLDWPNLG